MAKFVNISNHPSVKWDEAQRAAVQALEDDLTIVDVQFPNVDPKAMSFRIEEQAEKLLAAVIADHGKDALIHIMGETGFVFAFVTAAKARDIWCAYSTTERIAVETKNADGTVTKTAVFKFVQFRSF